MTPAQNRVAAGFLASLAAFVLAWFAFDVYLATTAPDATNTVSWSMALWVVEHPRGAVVLGFLAGATVVELICHIWLGQPTPELWDDYQAALKALGAAEKARDDLRAEADQVPGLVKRNAELRADADILRTEKRLIEDQCANYRQRTVDLEFALSDCQSGQRNEHGFPPGLPRLAPGTFPES